MDIVQIATLIIAVGVAMLGIYQTRLTSRLQEDINRLSVKLSQSIQRLERARDLINNIGIVCERFSSRVEQDAPSDHSANIETKTIINVSLVELRALSEVLEDQALKDAINQLGDSVDDVSPEVGEYYKEEVLNWITEIRPQIEKLHVRIYTLLDQATKSH